MQRSLVHLSLGLALVAGSGGVASASTIVLTGEHPQREALTAMLIEEGHQVRHAPLPRLELLESADVAWHLGMGELDATSRDHLLGFMIGGGGVMLTGDALALTGLDTSYEDLIGRAIGNRGAASGIDINLKPQPEGVHSFNPDAPGGATVDPTPLTTWQPIGVGAIAGLPFDNVLTLAPNGAVTAAIWSDADLDVGGRLIVMMDTDWVARGGAGVVANNLVRFLATQPELVPGCGDGTVQPGEACDDGNTDAGDGCDAGCAPEVPDEPTDPAGEVPAIDPGVGGVPVEGEGDEDEMTAASAGCSAGGAHAGGLVLLVVGLTLALSRKKA